MGRSLETFVGALAVVALSVGLTTGTAHAAVVMAGGGTSDAGGTDAAACSQAQIDAELQQIRDMVGGMVGSDVGLSFGLGQTCLPFILDPEQVPLPGCFVNGVNNIGAMCG